MELGTIGIWTNQLNSQKAGPYRDIVQELEGLGFGTLWSGESPSGREAFVNSAVTLAATSSLVVATGVASIWARDALAAASAHRVLSETYPGRFLLGLGVSHEGLTTMRGHTYDKPLTAMRNYLRAMDEHPIKDVPQPSEPAVRVLAALGPAMLELARDSADGAHPFLVPPEHTALAREALSIGKLLAPEQAVVLEADPEVARDLCRDDMGMRLGLPNYRKSLERLGFSERDFADGGSDTLIDRLYAWGSVDDVNRRVQEHLDAGADHVSLYVMHRRTDGPPLQEWRRLAELNR
ncbi:TIGR03620 family F420-dependent LLM class oxidoreductase [Aeromicrobium sp. 636]|uniref:TIGR03620 family F420-dependent LLM class oxidoreductase n=1 Tax=Aeromicrobium senzhongii TaxID=2663859 RepID=A0A8I0EVW0_9ACTN|nr:MULTISPECIES: TIGR03620 family F420-dependent LLM class oxidoreductase [Aeromicrobium]MBC9226489.1 TIGR03620 family F420-dependent LLM class oxidoreductase [Aeromicrobium senzhongii]MCQ3998593.1 TIGR03620 family F420-dependent LLM class oxidoreductase [Aeromicrobium sp. 636]